MATETKLVLRGNPAKPFDPILSLTRHWLKIVFFGTSLFGLFIPLALFISKPYYDATGKLRIAPVIPTFISQTEDYSITAYYHDYVRTQVNRIKKLSILEKAIDKLPDDLKNNFMTNNGPLSFAAINLEKRLEVSQIRDTHLIKIYLSADKPHGLAELINHIMGIYQAKLQEEEEGKDNRRLNYLQEEKGQLEIQIANQTRLLQQIADAAGTSTFSEMYNIFSRQLQDLQEAYTRAYAKRVEKENIYKEAVREAEALKELSLSSLVDEMVEKDQSLWDTSFWTYKTLQELRASQDGVAKNNPDRKYTDERMRGMQKYLQKLRNDVRNRAETIIKEKRDFELRQKIIQVEYEFIAAKKAETELRQERDRVQVQAAGASRKILNGQQIEAGLKNMRRLLDRIDERIRDLTLESRAPGRVTLESYARKPGKPAGNNKKKLLALFFVISFGGVLGLAVLFDSTDDRIRGPKDIINALGFPPTWPISDYLITRFQNTPFARVTLDDPSNVVAKAIRSLAVRLDQDRDRHGAKVAVFTAIDSGSGTSEIILNTAHAMARLCQKTLIIEANFIHPGLATLVNFDKSKPGLIDLLMGRADLPDCISYDPERGLDIILAGGIPTPEELSRLDQLRLISIFEDLKKQYNFIIADTAPVLISDLTEFFIARADSGVIVVQGDRTLYRELRMAAEIMSHLQLPAIAAVLNWGARRHKNFIQHIVSWLLWPVQNRLIKQKE